MVRKDGKRILKLVFKSGLIHHDIHVQNVKPVNDKGIFKNLFKMDVIHIFESGLNVFKQVSIFFYKKI